VRTRAAQTLFQLGSALEAAKQPEQALACYQRALEATPAGAARDNRNYTVAACLAGLKRYADARTLYEKLCKSEDEKMRTRAQAGLFQLGAVLDGQKQHEDALACYQAVIAVTPEGTLRNTRLLSLAACLTALKRYDEARPILEKIAQGGDAKLGPRAQQALTRLPRGKK